MYLEKRISFCLLIILLSCDNVSETEVKIKKIIAKDGDKHLNPTSVSVKRRDCYYLAYREDGEHNEYFVVYFESAFSKMEVCRVFANNQWDKIDSINHLIIKASKKISKFGLKLDTIYNDGDSTNIVLLDGKDLSDNSIYSIKSIYKIDQLSVYKLEKCFNGSSCPRF
ncbi:MAG: hypothetical protein J0H74_02640 [Chitinophagaceae bacterium]|nr:hypothetical protein [Chitinophagaceae bacterium]